jgi:hypothetical protein
VAALDVTARSTIWHVDEVRYTWAERDLPLLRESVRRIDAGEEWPAMREIATSCGIDPQQAEVAFDALQEDGYLVIRGRAMGGCAERQRLAGYGQGAP